MRVESIHHAASLFRDAVAGLPEGTTQDVLVRPHRVLELLQANREGAAEIALYGIYRDLHAEAATLGESRRLHPAELESATRRALFEAGNLGLFAHQAVAMRDHPDLVKRALERFGVTWDSYQSELTGLLEEQSRSLSEAEELEADLGAER